MRITSGCIVELEYELRNAEGNLIENTQNEGSITYLHGNEEIPPALEAELEGIEEGAEVEITLAAGVAYGDYNPDGIVSVPRSEFPADAEIVPGDWVSVQLSEEQDGEDVVGEEMEMMVKEISPEAITLDANHPLAGQQVTFEVRIISVRTATEAEIAKRKEEQEKGEDDDDE
jgi:FKBP-type peptidyl-prolyl cis-trans isomerase SlyD